MYVALIGGKSNRDVQLNRIERVLLDSLNIKRPRILFCAFATPNSIDKSFTKFKRLMQGIDCDITCMSLDDILNFKALLDTHDVLYVAGGVSDTLIDIFKQNKLDVILRDYLKSDKLYIGSSAGAMLPLMSSMGDKDMFSDNFHNYNYKMVDGLGLINIGICPHYQNEDLIIYNDCVKRLDYPSFGIEEDCALIIRDNMYYVLKDDRCRSVYLFDNLKDYVMCPLYEGVEYEDSRFRS